MSLFLYCAKTKTYHGVYQCFTLNLKHTPSIKTFNIEWHCHFTEFKNV